jgi:hypothetical protein
MTRGMALHPLVRALRNLLPGSTICMVHQRPWYSLTFAGTQICLSIELSGDHRLSIAKCFREALPKQEFDLPKQLVADIAVTDQISAMASITLIVDTLLLDD